MTLSHYFESLYLLLDDIVFAILGKFLVLSQLKRHDKYKNNGVF